MKHVSAVPSHWILSLLGLLSMTLACASPGISIRLPAEAAGLERLQDGNAAPSLPPGTSVQRPDGKEQTGSGKRPKSRTSIQLFLGSRHFSDGSIWAPVDDQMVFGSEFNWIGAESIFGFEIGAQFSADTEEQVVGAQKFEFGGGTSELYAGARLDLPLFGPVIHLLAGVGPSFLSARRSLETGGSVRSDSAGSVGLYMHLGLMLDLGDMGLGLDYRLRGGGDMTGFEDVFGSPVTGDANYGQLALTLALQF